MKKTIFIAMLAAGALTLGADEKVWPANYWQTVTNMVTTATPTGTATASQTVNLAGDVASTQSSPYNQQLEARMQLYATSGNTVADFKSFPPGSMLIIR